MRCSALTLLLLFLLAVSAGAATAFTPPALLPLSPKTAATVRPGRSVTFKWAPMSGAESYELALRDAPDAVAPIVTKDAAGTTVRLVLPQPLADGIYYWHVRARTGGVLGAYGAAGVLRVGRVPLTRAAAIEILDRQFLAWSDPLHAVAYVPQTPTTSAQAVVPHRSASDPEKDPSPVRVRRRSWFAFVDLFPQLKFSHTCAYALVDAATGKVTVSAQEWWPAVDGAALYASEDERVASPDRVEFPRRGPRSSGSAPRGGPHFLDVGAKGGSGLGVPKRTKPQNQVKKVAIVVEGAEDGEENAAFRRDADRMVTFFEGCLFTKVVRKRATQDTFQSVVDAIVAEGGQLDDCDKFVFYATGHGDRSTIDYGDKGGSSFYYKPQKDPKRVSLPTLLHDNVKAGAIDVILDACKSGSIVPQMETAFADKPTTNVQVQTASGADQDSLITGSGPFGTWLSSVFTDGFDIDGPLAVLIAGYKSNDGFISPDEFDVGSPGTELEFAL